MRTVLFVCTANICRSPMAVGIFDALAEQRGLPVRAESAGVAALVGDVAATHACWATDELGIEIGGHRARQVDADMLQKADLVLTMTPQHRDILHREFPEFREKIRSLPEYSLGDESGSIADPYGHSLGTYRASAREILRHVELVVKRLERERVEA